MGKLDKRDKDNILEVLSCYSRKEIEIMNNYDLNMMKVFATFPKSYIANSYGIV